jgi:hypothetical protein
MSTYAGFRTFISTCFKYWDGEVNVIIDDPTTLEHKFLAKPLLIRPDEAYVAEQV